MSHKHYRSFHLLILLLAFCTAFGQAGLSNGSKISMNVKDSSIYNVLKILESKTGLKFVVDPAIQERKLTVNLEDVYPDEAISVIMESNDLGFRRVEGVDVFIVSDKYRIMRETEIKLYSMLEALQVKDQPRHTRTDCLANGHLAGHS